MHTNRSIVLSGPLVHKSLLGHTPDYISDLLTLFADIPVRSALCGSSCGDLKVPSTRRRIDDRAVYGAAPRAWNRLAWTENIPIWVCLRAPKNRLICFVMRPRSTSRGQNTNISATVTVTVTVKVSVKSQSTKTFVKTRNSQWWPMKAGLLNKLWK